MASLSLTFAELQTEIEKYLGTYNSGSPGTADVTDAKMICNRSYARFVSYYDWCFLYQKRTIDTAHGQYVYELPSDFSYLTNNYLYFDADDGYPSIAQRSVGQIIECRSDVNYESTPLYFAVQAGNYTKETGQAWELILYPTPDSIYTLTYYAKINPEKLVSDGDIPIGGSDMSECLLELCLSYAETYKEEGKMVAFTQQVQQILGPAKMIDNKRRPKQLGTLNTGSSMFMNVETPHGGDIIISS